MSALSDKVIELRTAAGEFLSAMSALEAIGPASRLDPETEQVWRKLISDGRCIRAGIDTATRMIDGANRWVARTFNADAVSAIPFAADIVERVTDGALASINYFLVSVKAAAPRLERLQIQFAALPDEERAKMLAPTPVQSPAWSGLVLVGVLGLLAWWGANGSYSDFMKGDENE